MMNGMRWVVLLLGLAVTPLGAQQPAGCAHAKPDALVLYGSGFGERVFQISELAARAPRRVETVGHDGSPTVYEGVPLADLLRETGVMPVERLRGASLQRYVVAEASDGYRAVLALAEADSSYQATTVLVAYAADGAPLDERIGPLQLIVESDRQHGRWVRQLQCIRIAQDEHRQE